MITAVRTRGHRVWGAIGLYRQPDRPLFDAHEQGFLAADRPAMADAVRRACSSGSLPIPKVRMRRE